MLCLSKKNYFYISNFPVSDGQVERMYPNLSILYSYFKFYCKKEAYFDPSRGATAPMSWFYKTDSGRKLIPFLLLIQS